MKIKQLQLNLRPPKKKRKAGPRITIRWEKGSKIPAIAGEWRWLPDGRIEAMYNSEELKKCLAVFEAIKDVWKP